MKILVFGSNGMLGNYVCKYLTSKKKNVVAFTRANLDLTSDIKPGFLEEHITSEDVIINCAGVIKSQISDKTDPINVIKVNSIFPYLLQNECQRPKAKAIHVSTDCVYNGGNIFMSGYSETFVHDAEDLYGKSKSIGEAPKLTTIRTSIIGEEVGNARSLIEWAKSKKGQEIQGYTNHYWNGITCLQLAKVIEMMIDNNIFWEGVRHIYTRPAVTKCELLKLISDAFDLKLKITPTEAKFCNRKLFTLFSDTDKLLQAIPSYAHQLQELKDFAIEYRK